MQQSDQQASQLGQSVNSSTIQVKNIDRNTTEVTLRNVFSKFGKILSLTQDDSDSLSRNCFIEFQEDAEAEDAVNQGSIRVGDSQVKISLAGIDKEKVKNADIYVGGLNEQLVESHLAGYFHQFGKILSVSIHNCKRYGYIQFENSDDAQNALQNKSHIIEGIKVEVSLFKKKSERSQQQKTKNGLYITNIPVSVTQQEFEELMIKCGKVQNCHLKNDKLKDGFYFAYVTFESQQGAENAISTYQNREVLSQKIVLNIQWIADKKQEDSKSVVVKLLKEGKTSEEIRKLFSFYGNITSITNIKQEDEYRFLFITYENAEQAKIAQIKCYKSAKIKQLFINEIVKVDIVVDYYKSQIQNKILVPNQTMIPQMPMMPPMNFFPPMQPFPQRYNQFYPKRNPYYNNRRYNNYNNNNNYNNRGRGYRNQNQQNNHHQNDKYHNNNNQQPQQQQPQQQQTNIKTMDSEQLKQIVDKLKSWQEQGQEKEVWTYLGSFVYPEVVAKCENEKQAGQITGMLIDLEVYQIEEVLDLVRNPALLEKQMQEAIEVISAE